MEVQDKSTAVQAPRWARPFLRPGFWFRAAIALGAAVRLYLVIFTQGTDDVSIWKDHATNVNRLGLVAYYRSSYLMNHPPLIALAAAFLAKAESRTGLPFRILWRLPFAVLDAGTLLMLLVLLRSKPWRFGVAAAYWLNPLAIIFSAYHGNTDTAVALSVLLCVWAWSKSNFAGAGAALGAGLWIKLPGILAAPAVFLSIHSWHKRLVFVLSLAVVATIGYLPVGFSNVRVLIPNVLGYRGTVPTTSAGTPIWGFPAMVYNVSSAPEDSWVRHPWILGWLLEHPWLIGVLKGPGWQVALVCMLLVVWLRPPARSSEELCKTIAVGYTVIYAFSNNWALQYLAWAVPFWYFVSPVFVFLATLLASGYVYSLYWCACGNPWLLGPWKFSEHTKLPTAAATFGTLAFLFFLVAACVFTLSAASNKVGLWLTRLGVYRTPDGKARASPEAPDRCPNDLKSR